MLTLESAQHINRQEKKRRSLRGERPKRRSPHAHRRESELSVDKNVVEGNVGAREDNRGRDQRPRFSRAYE